MILYCFNASDDYIAVMAFETQQDADDFILEVPYEMPWCVSIDKMIWDSGIII